MPQTIQFGIPTFDQLLDHKDVGKRRHGIHLDKEFEAISICIVGPDGMGKSVLAMHLASTYLANHDAKVLYTTSDLSFDRANTIWRNFALSCPANRVIDPFGQTREQQGLRRQRVELECFNPAHPNPALLLDPTVQGQGTVVFIDLASQTAGDDWGLLNRVVALLPVPANRHLLVIDAVEGLETRVGAKDAFGEEHDRRSRISQILRTASGKCHVVFIVEEPGLGRRTPEEFVADVVIHLRFHAQRDYSRRTIEVEKVRGQTHARGEHDFAIRGGGGSRTGKVENPDDPKVEQRAEADGSPASAPTGAGASPSQEGKPQAYFHVFPSIHFLYRSYMEQPPPPSLPTGDPAGFGIKYLDDMLGGSDGGGGLPVDAPAAVIGEDGTYKSRLGRAFLSQCFAGDQGDWGVAVLLSTRAIECEKLADRCAAHLSQGGMTVRPEDIKAIRQRIVCRHLEIHHLSPSVLVHIVRRLIEKAQRILAGGASPQHNSTNRRNQFGKIRFVVDNWSAIEQTYPEVANDPLFLPYLLLYLRRKGICSLFIATEEGGPIRILERRQASRLRELTQHHLYTWHVNFFGESRVAIAAIPPISRTLPLAVREVRSSREKPPRRLTYPEALVIDPHFELYTGLEEGQPRFVPLSIHLYAETDAFMPYLTEMNEVLSRLVPGQQGRDKVLIPEKPDRYERLREFSYLQGGIRLDHTLVLQVDEFWAESRTAFQLQKQERYMRAATVNNQRPIRIEDPLLVFQLSKEDLQRGVHKGDRCEFFDTIGYDSAQYAANGWTIDKVPYLWDFGFLLCRWKAWQLAIDNGNPRLTSGSTVGKVLDLLRTPPKRQRVAAVSWREFFEACRVVAALQRSHDSAGPVYPFDVSMIATETFSCLVLEIWASEIAARNDSSIEKVFPKHRHDRRGWALPKLVEKYDHELYKTWLLLAEVIAPAQFATKGNTFKARPADPRAVAVRHWYSTATAVPNEAHDPWIPVGLPGRYSVRGDWFLAVARGSRSPRLGDRAMDLLCSRRGNIVRLQTGLGLPVRDLEREDIRHAEMWTPLVRFDQDGSRQRVMYREIRDLGGWDEADRRGRLNFHWLWRSLIQGYDRHARIWQRWLCRTYTDWIAMVPPGRGFELYGLNRNRRQIPERELFMRRCDALVETLRRVTIP